jgi:hypothetical protein
VKRRRALLRNKPRRHELEPEVFCLGNKFRPLAILRAALLLLEGTHPSAHAAEIITEIALASVETLGAQPQGERRPVLGWSRPGGKDLPSADLRVRT